MKAPSGRTLLALLAISGAGLAVYANTWQSSFHFDDQTSLLWNFSIQRLQNLRAIWDFWPTRFFTYLSFAFDYHCHQLDVTGYHIVNTFIHVVTAMGVWWLACLTWGLTDRGRIDEETGRLVALLAALIFVSHPIQTQAVTYITQRATSLAGLFYVTSLCFYIRSRQEEMTHTPSFYYGTAIGLGFAAMFTKETSVTLPFALWLYEAFFLSPKTRKPWGRLAPFFALACLVPIVMVVTRSVDLAGMHRVVEPAPGITPWSYALTQARVLVTYLRLLFFPVAQNLDYDYPVYSSFWALPVFLSCIILSGLVYAAWRCRRSHPVLSFGIFWFFITLAPESSFIPIRDVIFEHRLYLPMVGFALAVPWVLLVSWPVRYRVRVVSGLVLFVLILMVAAIDRNRVWKDETSLALDVLRHAPRKARAYKTLAYERERQGDIAGAIALYQKALSIDPSYAEIYYNRGNILAGQGSYSLALDEYDTAIRFNPRDPWAYHNRGLVYAIMGDLDQALSDLDQALKLGFRSPVLFRNRARLFVERNDPDRAMQDYDRAIALDPDDAATRFERQTLEDLRGA